MYFPFSELRKWSKKTAETRRRNCAVSRDWPAELQALSAGYPVTEYAVEISGTAFAREHGISDEPVYLCMFANGHGYQRGLDIAAYILENG